MSEFDYRPNPKFPAPDYPAEKRKYAEKLDSQFNRVSTSELRGMWVAYASHFHGRSIVPFISEIEALRYVVCQLEQQMHVKFVPYGTDLIKALYE